MLLVPPPNFSNTRDVPKPRNSGGCQGLVPGCATETRSRLQVSLKTRMRRIRSPFKEPCCWNQR